MEMREIVTLDTVLAGLKPNSKKQLLQSLAEVAAKKTNRDEREIFDTLLERERLGSTGVGNGVAIPHGKMQDLEGIVGIFAQLAKPVEFDSSDDAPVDIVFMLLAPEGSGADHLKALSRIARLLRNEQTLSVLRASPDPKSIYDVLCEVERENAA